MKRIVIKFGGTSVGSIEKIINAAKIVKRRHEEGNEVIVVVSAMSGTTNDLINKSKKIRLRWLSEFSKDIKLLLNQNKKIIIVSSGAIAIGCKKLKIKKKI